jgi:uncharacterized protein with HEPN domain
MPRDGKVYLEDIRVACMRILGYVGKDPQSAWDEKTLDAVIRNLEVIGEAAKQLPDDLKSRQPQVEWKKIAGLRDVLIHHYFSVNETIIRDAVYQMVPGLLEAVRRLILT